MRKKPARGQRCGPFGPTEAGRKGRGTKGKDENRIPAEQGGRARFGGAHAVKPARAAGEFTHGAAGR